MKALLLLVLPWLSPANYTDNLGNLHILYSELWVQRQPPPALPSIYSCGSYCLRVRSWAICWCVSAPHSCHCVYIQSHHVTSKRAWSSRFCGALSAVQDSLEATHCRVSPLLCLCSTSVITALIGAKHHSAVSHSFVHLQSLCRLPQNIKPSSLAFSYPVEVKD